MTPPLSQAVATPLAPLRKLYMKTYGCQMNVYDSQRMAETLAPLGYTLVESPDGSDMIILNTCHIREKAEEKLFSDLGRLKPHKTENQKLILAVAGCVAQAQGEEIFRRAPYVDMVFGPQTYHQLPEMLAQAIRSLEKETQGPGRGVVNLDFPAESKFDFLPEPKASGPTAFLAIQEGCDKFCTFCVVPYTRGAEYSRPAAQILAEAKQLIAGGAQELTLLGQNVNAYHGDSPCGKQTWSLGRLFYALAELPGLKRIRYMTSHPRDMHDELVKAHGDIPALMPFIHLPVQSGSSSVLKRMNRRHGVEMYETWIQTLRDARPDMAFSSDFIVGFPGETDADFEQTLTLVRKVGYAQAYSFKYSPRPGTPGALYEDQIPETVKDQRLQVLQALLGEQQLSYNQAMVGSTLPVLFERKGKKAGQWMGKSPYMQSVYVETSENLMGTLGSVSILNGFASSLSGQLV
ncbi:MAG: tRNA (N6-isopentenyl adenosine(37)-C2)-methylthiotransferase MiaB [Alphaproteobacteria bacterium]